MSLHIPPSNVGGFGSPASLRHGKKEESRRDGKLTLDGVSSPLVDSVGPSVCRLVEGVLGCGSISELFAAGGLDEAEAGEDTGGLVAAGMG